VIAQPPVTISPGPMAGVFLLLGVGKAGRTGHVICIGGMNMPLPYFLLMLLGVIAAAGATIALFTWTGLPLVALGFAALAGSLILGARQWR
jgi:hypothetical protein